LVKIPFRGTERKGTETPPPDLVELDLSDAEIAEDQEGSNSEDEDFSPPEEDRKQRRKAGSDKKVTPGKVPKTPPRKTQATATANTRIDVIGSRPLRMRGIKTSSTWLMKRYYQKRR